MLTDSDQEMSNILDKYFRSVFIKKDLSSIPGVENVYRGREEDKLCNISVTRYDVLKQISKAKPNKSPGPDEFIQESYVVQGGKLSSTSKDT